MIAQERKRRRIHAEAQFLRWLASGELEAWGHGASEGPLFDRGRWRMAEATGKINWDASSLMGRDWRISEIVVDAEMLGKLISAMKAPSVPKAASKRGRKALAVWTRVRKEVFELMDEHGEFGFDSSWIQARLEDAIWHSINGAAEKTAIREHVAKYVAESRTDRSKAGK
jgi:hypothetical protein